MTQLARAQVVWSGQPGMPGVSTFYWKDTDGAQVAALKTFFDALKGNFPTGVTITYPSTGIVFNDTNGAAVGTWTASAPAATTCTGVGNYAGPSGGVISWRTGVYVSGRELRGKTFLVPMMAAAMDDHGRFVSGVVTAVKAAAAPLYAGTKPIQIWSKLRGTSAPVVAADFPQTVAVLRSRRD